MHLPCSHSLQKGQSFDTAMPSTCTNCTGKCHDIGFHEAWQEPFKHLHGFLPLASFFTWASTPQIDHALLGPTGVHCCPKILRCTMLTPWQRVSQWLWLVNKSRISQWTLVTESQTLIVAVNATISGCKTLSSRSWRVNTHMGYRIQLRRNPFIKNKFPRKKEPLRGSPVAVCLTLFNWLGMWCI